MVAKFKKTEDGQYWNHEQYRLVDLYEGLQVIKYSDSLQEISKALEQWIRETDGECWIEVQELEMADGCKLRFVRRENGVK